MPALVFYPFETFMRDTQHKLHNFSTDEIGFVLTTTAPNTITSTVLADISGTVSLANLAGSDNLFVTSSGHVGGDYTLDIADKIIEATGGSVGPFRYIVVYNKTAAGNPLICYFDTGGSVTLEAGQYISLVISSSGLYTITHVPA